MRDSPTGWKSGPADDPATSGIRSIAVSPFRRPRHGRLLGEKFIASKSALVEAPMGKGKAILFGFRPQYRAQSYLTLKLLFNALVM